MIIFDYFITEYICLNGLFITFIIFNDSIYNHRTTKTNQKYPSVNL